MDTILKTPNKFGQSAMMADAERLTLALCSIGDLQADALYDHVQPNNSHYNLALRIIDSEYNAIMAETTTRTIHAEHYI